MDNGTSHFCHSDNVGFGSTLGLYLPHLDQLGLFGKFAAESEQPTASQRFYGTSSKESGHFEPATPESHSLLICLNRTLLLLSTISLGIVGLCMLYHRNLQQVITQEVRRPVGNEVQFVVIG